MHLFMCWIWILILILRQQRRGRPAHPQPEVVCNESILPDPALHHTHHSTQVCKGVAAAAAAAPQPHHHHPAAARLELGAREEEPYIPYRQWHFFLLPSVLHDDAARPALIVHLKYKKMVLA